MVRSMFEGARIGVDVEVDGRIIKTNAPAIERRPRDARSRSTSASCCPTRRAFRRCSRSSPGTDFDTVRKALEGAKGVKIPLALAR